MCRFTLAIDDGYGESKRTNYIPVVVFGKQAVNCANYLEKGRKTCVQGRIQTGSYEKDGRKVYTTDVIASSVEFLGKVDKNIENEPKDGEKSNFSLSSGFARVEDDDIPF
jgi:single-strand DNA-binding protein